MISSESELSQHTNRSPDDPAIDRLPWEALNREQKVEGIQIELARKAAQGGGMAGMLVKNVSDEVFNGNGSDSYVRDLVKEAVEIDGYWLSKSQSGKQTIETRLSEIWNDDLLDVATDDDSEQAAATTSADGGIVATDGGRGLDHETDQHQEADHRGDRE